MENTRDLSKEEQMSSFEKILLMTGHINLISSNVKMVLHSRAETIHAMNKGVIESVSPEFMQQMFEETQQLLDETAAKLYTIYEELVDFCNNCDAVSDVDIQLGEPVFNVMHDRISIREEEEEEDEEIPEGAVLITPEVLRKYDFIDISPKKNGAAIRTMITEGDELVWYMDDGYLRYQTRASGFTRSLEHVKYMHQLQGFVFCLTGKELQQV